ncbi:cathepsin G-like [Tachyglossus aculeatus]|uniref:cathepsin G-like n=1 Tax=Tachyglossus aculeatus TaxID=9261 RepID=UPI0018F68841|nr:cathepsin G-like [Tachyglossus aculeatus]
MQSWLLFLLALLLPPGAGAGEIIGGKEARPHSRPYMAYLNFYKNGTLYACGGFLVREDFVLTAAHCNGSEMSVTLGAHNISSREATQQRFPVVKKFFRKYNNRTLANDIMLLKLGHAVNMTKEVEIIRLPKRATGPKPGTKCSVAGWGKMEVNGRGSSTLQEVKLDVVFPSRCHIFRSFYSRYQLCVGKPKSYKSSFKGDSGGPLVCGKRAQGILSYVRSDGRPPNVFTRISFYLPWIKEILGKN